MPADPIRGATPAVQSLRVLVVEDNEDVARSQSLLLKALGHWKGDVERRSGPCSRSGEKRRVFSDSRTGSWITPPNDAHHWRRANGVQYATETESRRPVHLPG